MYKINAYGINIRTNKMYFIIYLKPLIISNMYLNRLKVWKTIRLTKYSASYASVLCGLIVAVNFFFLNVSRTGFFCIFYKKKYIICLYRQFIYTEKHI